MSTTEGGSSGEPKYRILDKPPPPDTPGPRLLAVVPEGESVDDYVIEDLEAAEGPSGGATKSCVCCKGCMCNYG